MKKNRRKNSRLTAVRSDVVRAAVSVKHRVKAQQRVQAQANAAPHFTDMEFDTSEFDFSSPAVAVSGGPGSANGEAGCLSTSPGSRFNAAADTQSIVAIVEIASAMQCGGWPCVADPYHRATWVQPLYPLLAPDVIVALKPRGAYVQTDVYASGEGVCRITAEPGATRFDVAWRANLTGGEVDAVFSTAEWLVTALQPEHAPGRNGTNVGAAISESLKSPTLIDARLFLPPPPDESFLRFSQIAKATVARAREAFSDSTAKLTEMGWGQEDSVSVDELDVARFSSGPWAVQLVAHGEFLDFLLFANDHRVASLQMRHQVAHIRCSRWVPEPVRDLVLDVVTHMVMAAGKSLDVTAAQVVRLQDID
jgi:hypothetical protein